MLFISATILLWSVYRAIWLLGKNDVVTDQATEGQILDVQIFRETSLHLIKKIERK